MDREYVVTFLLLATAAPALWVWNSRAEAVAPRERARRAEASCWRAIWTSTWPLVLTVAAIGRWWLAVPDPVPVPPITILTGGLLFAFVGVRAGWRAGRSAWLTRHPYGLATIGLWRPRIVMSDAVRRALNAAEARAALAHETAHVRHHDPRRIWLAQFVTDLQWPWPRARRRFAVWRLALEMARDEEARLEGIAGPDLAAAIIAVARLQQASGTGAMLAGDPEWDLKQRIARLLAPLPTDHVPRVPRVVSLGALLTTASVVVGLTYGKALVWVALRLLP